MKTISILTSVVILTLLASAGVQGQTQLPQPDPEFKGKIEQTYNDSTPSYPRPVTAPKGSPNVLLILLDDVGFGMCSTFGGPVPTPNMENYPTLYRNTVPVKQPKTPEQGYHFTEDITDEAIAWTRIVRAANADKPWFCYFSTGAVHAPHHAPARWREMYTGKFDHGWDKQRELTHAKQLEIGVIPTGTKLTPRPPELAAWDDQSPEAKKVYLRRMENYAAFMAHTDHPIGRLIDSLEDSGELENTLVLYIVGDNGASAEGGLEGTFSELASLLGVQLGLESTINRLDEIGTPSSEPHVPVAWAWAMCAPFQWTKQVASHFGARRIESEICDSGPRLKREVDGDESGEQRRI